MILETDKIIEMYYEKIKDIYPDLTLHELNIICRSPFSFLKAQMKRAILPSIRFQYWGVFAVKKKRLTHVKNTVDQAFADGLLKEAKYNKVKAIIEADEKQNNFGEY